jgi:hypothetical protein
MRALIVENGVVVNATKVADADFADAQGWIVSDLGQIGDLWDGEAFTSPPKPPVYATAAEARLAMVKWIDGLTAQVMDQYPRAVQARWSIEEAAARAVKADTATADQLALVTNEGAAKGRTPTEHADAIIANADRFRAIADQINTLFLATDKALTDETNPEQYEAILDGAKAQAAPLAAAYGLST